MKRIHIPVLALCLAVLAARAQEVSPPPPEKAGSAFVPGKLFEKVAETLLGRFHDRSFREERLPPLVEEHRPLAQAAPDLEAEAAAVGRFLSRVPASHLALLERRVHRAMMGNLMNRRRPDLGFQVERLEGGFFVYRLYERGPAALAGLRRGDRVLEIDGVPIQESPLLQGSSDDAALPDPPLHGIQVEEDQDVALLVEREPEVTRVLRVRARGLCDLDASRESARVVETDDGLRFGVVHLWSVTATGTGELVRELLQGRFEGLDGVVLDLRGRGGSAMVVGQIVSFFRGRRPIFHGPLVALTDRCTRSAKEAIAREIRRRGAGRLVGERTAGALLPASFRNVGQGYVLMFPATTLGALSREVEGVGVVPDVEVADAGPYGAGKDPILEAGLAEVWRMARATPPVEAPVPSSR